MAELTRQVSWDAADRVSLRTLFSSITGRKFLALIRTQLPRAEGKTMEEVAIASLKKQGAEDVIRFIEQLAADVVPDMQEGVDYIDLSKEGD
jgi:hypothetical protein